MSRKNAREIALHLIFEMTFQDGAPETIVSERLDSERMASIGREIGLYATGLEGKDREYIEKVVTGVYQERETLDAVISEHARGWALSRLSRMTTSILRLALYEIREMQDVPAGAAINEAVELAKTYESAETGAFVNGILGTVSRAQDVEPHE